MYIYIYDTVRWRRLNILRNATEQRKHKEMQAYVTSVVCMRDFASIFVAKLSNAMHIHFQLVNEFCKLDLTCPVPGCGQQETRILLLEGGLKLRDKDSKVRRVLWGNLLDDESLRERVVW